jgi:hypothetical protein
MARIGSPQKIAGAWLALLLAFASVHATGPSKVRALHGFQVDFGAITDRESQSMLASLEHQLEIIEAANLPERVLIFFRTVPIVVDPSLIEMNGEYRQRDGKWAVGLKPISLPRDRAILLHELLHAYQHQVLGIPTPAVGRAYRQAIESDIYPRKYRGEYFLKNGREYFAVIGEIYLSGRTHRPPYDCSIVKREQPEFLAFLAQHFGERECH